MVTSPRTIFSLLQLDFWLYEAFPQKELDILISHHRQLGTVKSLKRGRQFNSYSQGEMIPKGARIPQGGRPGDAYTFYEGMEAITHDEINALFNDAEVCAMSLTPKTMLNTDIQDSMILSVAARILSYPITKQLEEDSADADRLGISGANTYLCNNYTSPLHRDHDSGTGLCAQYELQALCSLDEYSFNHADYGLYMVSRRNSLW